MIKNKISIIFFLLLPHLVAAQFGRVLNRAADKLENQLNKKIDNAIDQTIDKKNNRPIGDGFWAGTWLLSGCRQQAIEIVLVRQSEKIAIKSHPAYSSCVGARFEISKTPAFFNKEEGFTFENKTYKINVIDSNNIIIESKKNKSDFQKFTIERQTNKDYALSILENTSQKDKLGIIVYSGKDMVLISGNKNSKGDLTQVETIHWAAADASSWTSIQLDNNGLPKAMLRSNGDAYSFEINNETVTATSYQKKQTHTHKISPQLLTDVASALKQGSPSISDCDTVPPTYLSCSKVSTVIKGAITTLSIVECASSVAASIELLPVAPLLSILNAAYGAEVCSGAVDNSKDFMDRLVGCRNNTYKYLKNKQSINSELSNAFDSGIKSAFINFINNKDHQNTSGQTFLKDALKETAKSAITAIANNLADQLDQEVSLQNKINPCKEAISPKALVKQFSVYIHSGAGKNQGPSLKLKDGESAPLYVKYCKSKEPVLLELHFLALEGNSNDKNKWIVKHVFTKELPASQTQGFFQLTIKHSGGLNCRSTSALGYVSSNNSESTWIVPIVVVDGKRYRVGSKEGPKSCQDGWFFMQYESPTIDFLGEGQIGVPYCTYEIIEP